MALLVVHSESLKPWFILAEDEDRCLRYAFGRYGENRGHAIDAPAAILEKYRQAMAGKCWLACDCRDGDGVDPPFFSVVGQGSVRPHLRRLEAEFRSEHSPDCDFWLEHWQQEAIGRSYLRSAQGGDALLIPVIPLMDGIHRQQPAVRLSRLGVNQERPPLARLLAELFEGAGLQRVRGDGLSISINDQYAAVWKAAEKIELRPGIRLNDYFCTSSRVLWKLRKDVQNADPSIFHPAIPHGVFIGLVEAVDDHSVTLRHGERVQVMNEIQVFSNLPRTEALGQSDDLFMAAIVFVSINGGPAMAFDAYLHPVAGPGRLMLLSNFDERVALGALCSIQKYLRAEEVIIEIEKPIFSDPMWRVGRGRPLSVDFVVKRASPTPNITMPILAICSPSPRYLSMKTRLERELGDAFGSQVGRYECYPQSEAARRGSFATFYRRLKAVLMPKDET